MINDFGKTPFHISTHGTDTSWTHEVSGGTVLICSLLSAPSFAYATESAFRSVNSYLPPLPRIRSEGVYGHFWGLAAVKSPNNVKNLAANPENWHYKPYKCTGGIKMN